MVVSISSRSVSVAESRKVERSHRKMHYLQRLKRCFIEAPFFMGEIVIMIKIFQFFIAMTLSAGLQAAVSVLDSQACQAFGNLVPVQVDRVVDGDTVLLKDGRRVRLIGVNTPEIGRNGKAGDPLGIRAQGFLEDTLKASGQLYLIYGEDRSDRYGRILAHLFDSKKQSVEAKLLESGLAMRAVVSPNIQLQNCFIAAEKIAHNASIGVWSSDYWVRKSELLDRSSTGFRIVSGEVSSVSLKGKRWWVNMSGDFSFYVVKSDQRFFDREWVKHLPGKRLWVRGWVVERNLTDGQKAKGYKGFNMKVSHPLAIEALSH